MLFLQHAADGSAQVAPAQVPMTDAAALYLEHALLAGDSAARLHEVERAVASDRNLAEWALGRAETCLGRTINRVDEAARWLSEHLVSELAGSLGTDFAANSADSIEWRLPALVKKLFELDRRQANFETRLEREKLDAMKELAYGASHEINNPLANIAARAQTLLDGEDAPERRQKLIAIHRQAIRAHEMISDLMLFARPPKLKPQPFRIQQVISNAVAGLADLGAEYHVQFIWTDDEPPIEIVADETQLGVAVHAVVKNAIEAAVDGGSVAVKVQKVVVHDKPHAEIVVRDDGPGISDETRRHIFDPFFSGREAGRGLGFGLSKCWRIVTDHGGQVIVARPAGGGTEITILLPLQLDTANTGLPLR